MAAVQCALLHNLSKTSIFGALDRISLSLISFHFFQNHNKQFNKSGVLRVLGFQLQKLGWRANCQWRALGSVRCFVFLRMFFSANFTFPNRRIILNQLFLFKNANPTIKSTKKVHSITLLLFLVLITDLSTDVAYKKNICAKM